MAEVRFIDTTIRDGAQSLWAMNMRTHHMVPVLRELDRAGFDQIEFFSPGSRMKKFVRHLHENPWDWVYQGVQQADLTPLRWHGIIWERSLSGTVPPEVGELLVSKAVQLGITHTRIGDNWNNFTVNKKHKEQLERLGMTPVVNIIYSVSPKHTDEYFFQKAREASSLKPWRLCLKDVGGLLTPERVRALLPRLIELTPGIPWEFHGHCTNSLGPLNAIEAVRAGVQFVHTAVPPLANGSSLPSIYNVARNLSALGYEHRVDLEPLRRVTDLLERVATEEGFDRGAPQEYDELLYRHQVPGGMISNLKYQLELVGMTDKLEEMLEEAAQVRADFGYPIMITPLSQFVGTQAAVNVIVGERYREVTDAVIEYALGRHGGEEASEGMDQVVRAKILDRPRANELAAATENYPTLVELRKKYGPNTSDEDLILLAIVGDDALDVLEEYKAVAEPAKIASYLHLIEQLLRDGGPRSIHLDIGPLSALVVHGRVQ